MTPIETLTALANQLTARARVNDPLSAAELTNVVTAIEGVRDTLSREASVARLRTPLRVVR